MKRHEDWDLKLHDFIESRTTTPFEWGENDCCLFVADAVQAMTGVDMAAEFRGTYSDKEGAFARIAAVTGKRGIADVLLHETSTHELDELPSPLFAQRGDILLYEAEVTAIGVLYFDGKHGLFVGEEGLRKLPLRMCSRAWRVG